MARPKGALNKRTRAALAAATEGKLGERAEETIAYLLKIANDPATEHNLRVQAANAALPYCKPRLASIEQTNIEPKDQLDPKELEAKLASKYAEKPEAFEYLVTVVVRDNHELRARLSRLLQQLAPEAPASGNVLQIVK